MGKYLIVTKTFNLSHVIKNYILNLSVFICLFAIHVDSSFVVHRKVIFLQSCIFKNDFLKDDYRKK